MECEKLEGRNFGHPTLTMEIASRPIYRGLTDAELMIA
jgi:hypothetical protein